MHALTISVAVSFPIALLQATLGSLSRQYSLASDDLRKSVAEVLARDGPSHPFSRLTWRKFFGNFRERSFWRVLLSTWLVVGAVCLGTCALLILSLGLYT
jgi:hypothetical protein